MLSLPTPARDNRCPQSTLKTALPSYMDEGGWGVVLLLVSLMLTRGVHVVRSLPEMYLFGTSCTHRLLITFRTIFTLAHLPLPALQLIASLLHPHFEGPIRHG